MTPQGGRAIGEEETRRWALLSPSLAREKKEPTGSLDPLLEVSAGGKKPTACRCHRRDWLSSLERGKRHRSASFFLCVFSHRARETREHARRRISPELNRRTCRYPPKKRMRGGGRCLLSLFLSFFIPRPTGVEPCYFPL